MDSNQLRPRLIGAKGRARRKAITNSSEVAVSMPSEPRSRADGPKSGHQGRDLVVMQHRCPPTGSSLSGPFEVELELRLGTKDD